MTLPNYCLTCNIYTCNHFRWGQIKDLPRMGALSMVKDGNEVLLNLGLGTSEYSELVMNLVVLASIYLSIR